MMAYDAVKTIVEYHDGVMPEEVINPVDVKLVTGDNINEVYPD